MCVLHALKNTLNMKTRSTTSSASLYVLSFIHIDRQIYISYLEFSWNLFVMSYGEFQHNINYINKNW